MNNTRLFILVLAIAGALWALFTASPQAGRVAILLYIVLLPEAILVAEWLTNRARG